MKVQSSSTSTIVVQKIVFFRVEGSQPGAGGCRKLAKWFSGFQKYFNYFIPCFMTYNTGKFFSLHH